MDKTDLPPVAHNTICVDFDGTIFQWGDIYAQTPPFEGCVEVIRNLRKQGWYIVIFTSRMSPTWWASEGWDFEEAERRQYDFVAHRLVDYGIPFDRITAEKVPAEYYIDDKAIRFEGDWFKIRGKVL
jgi:hypothetical protein